MNIFLTESQIGKIFSINAITIKKLAREHKIPCVCREGKNLFDPKAIAEWVENNPLVQNNEDLALKKLQAEWQRKSPEAFAALQAIDLKTTASSRAQKEPKKYSLIKVPNKKYGFLYYVRYNDKGKQIPSKWNTHTNILQEAEEFAQANRARLIAGYRAKHTETGEVYSVLEAYYRPDSSYLENDKNRNRVMGEKTRSVYYHFVNDTFIPFLRDNGVKTFSDIDCPLIANLQNHLLSKGFKPQTINRYLGCVRAAFDQFLLTGVIRDNAFDRIRMLRTSAKKTFFRGCYEIDKLKGVFNKGWEDRLPYLLCLVIYTTGMRNSEIEKIRVKDIIEMEGVHFIDITRSKTKNGVRLVPVHDFVYKKLKRYIQEAGKGLEEYLFSRNGGPNQSRLYNEANAALGEKLGLSVEQLKELRITFYSGRHFWKTLMNSGGLGNDVEEYFMGHKVSGDVAENYNHKNKQGRAKLLKKVQGIFGILERRVFRGVSR